MSTPDTNILSRYQTYRTRRFLENDAKTRHWLPGWRTQHRRRVLAVAVLATLFVLLVLSISTLFWKWAPLAWLPATAAFLVLWTILQTVSGRHSDAPVGALDEWEVEQRNEARSIGLTVTQGTVLTAVIALVFLSTTLDNDRLAYAGGLWTLVALLTGICSPAIILAWITPDPDPEDL
ncbi:hypothetical protein HQ346_15760 [Rhodococcus sp. BP-252]|uniref:Uncharacterized protein n=1 Tax=Rhodococcoides kyotonense TaxID=398843 RepID=A0A177YFX5_9NOCA|nr:MULTISPECIES: hypothetical protein [Rhodococcus]MBY6413082.1 hypothetical protein [Rhodococcus sp. BP-320]MBY6417755.1 hypothetical protein [Rhodococcus sp. BP-321]MBY6423905.1 hypothetical protein [Rhodococcus sp. BP-324]MBY6427824.1 hypothetical protein [Rhodococcus sp. BP-323]MBY6431823.1 hypothetical protein [Rhodococcus sp. BP-322]